MGKHLSTTYEVKEAEKIISVKNCVIRVSEVGKPGEPGGSGDYPGGLISGASQRETRRSEIGRSPTEGSNPPLATNSLVK